ncbi:hypothetical protein RND71_021646 [Anisodus tanguticus]|uniref:Uncharacterized protein n=1 Tax=Anisodus tanguticus TaxID=243964 RepID=A0AAE1RYI6_9SOLA|nr:hypothetical protein RND71_021646 [Anisodus tanguticus]
MLEPSQPCFPHLVRHEGHSDLVSYNFISNPIFPSMSAHSSEHHHLCYLHLLNVSALDRPTLCPIQ